MAIDIHTLLQKLVEKNSSDLHITANSTPKMRIDEKLIEADKKVLTVV